MYLDGVSRNLHLPATVAVNEPKASKAIWSKERSFPSSPTVIARHRDQPQTEPPGGDEAFHPSPTQVSLLYPQNRALSPRVRLNRCRLFNRTRGRC
jgi:hypothetical protein